MRITTSLKNIFFGIGSQFVSTCLAFVNKTIFIYFLGAEYLGIDGLFTNILSLLSLANLGFDSAIIYSLYKPLSEDNQSEVKGYMQLFSKVYKGVGIFVFILGILLIPALPNIINDKPSINENLIIIYMLFLLNSSISYFYIYKQSIIIANQKNYLISKIHTLFVIISNVVQILLLIIFKNYILLLLFQIILKIIENIYISHKADKEFPYLLDKNIKGSLSSIQKKRLYKNVYSMLMYKISGTIINSTDNIVISAFLGTISVGIYSSYLIIISTIRTFISYVFHSLTASVGNLIASNEDEKKEFIFNQIYFLSFFIYGIISIGLYILLDDFIILWIGEQFLLNQFTKIIIIINFYTIGMQGAATMYRDTSGLFNVGKYRPLIAAAINVGCSLLLVKPLGIAGVLLGTIISRLFTYFWYDPYVIYKYLFNKKCTDYFYKYVQNIIILVSIGVVSVAITSYIHVEGNFILFFIKAFLSTSFSTIALILLYWRNEHFKYVKNIGIDCLKKCYVLNGGNEKLKCKYQKNVR